MIKCFITAADITKVFPKYTNLLGSGETSANLEEITVDELTQDLYSQGYLSRNLMLPLVLVDNADVAINNSTYSDASDADAWQRQRIFISGTCAIIAVIVLTLKGSDNDVDYYTVLTETISAIPIGSFEYDFKFAKSYRYYKVLVAPTVALTVVRTELYEVCYDRLLIYKWLEIYFRNKSKSPGDIWENYTNEFKDLYEEKLKVVRIGYDKDESGDYTLDETVKQNLVEWSR